mmetsp:Transcript_115650/g.274857  ORF Transcript_115650/g.274857 Transcript_115650/m.274857 type:complete len:230 (+) Transcript_115650:405-1094(+)
MNLASQAAKLHQELHLFPCRHPKAQASLLQHRGEVPFLRKVHRPLVKAHLGSAPAGHCPCAVWRFLRQRQAAHGQGLWQLHPQPLRGLGKNSQQTSMVGLRKVQLIDSSWAARSEGFVGLHVPIFIEDGAAVEGQKRALAAQQPQQGAETQHPQRILGDIHLLEAGMVLQHVLQNKRCLIVNLIGSDVQELQALNSGQVLQQRCHGSARGAAPGQQEALQHGVLLELLA